VEYATSALEREPSVTRAEMTASVKAAVESVVQSQGPATAVSVDSVREVVADLMSEQCAGVVRGKHYVKNKKINARKKAQSTVSSDVPEWRRVVEPSSGGYFSECSD